MIPIETVPGIMGGGMKERNGVGNSNTYLIDCKNLYTCYSVPIPSTKKKKKVIAKEMRMSLNSAYSNKFWVYIAGTDA
jgi:hypothetical protein